jgi:hypothetical protein
MNISRPIHPPPTPGDQPNAEPKCHVSSPTSVSYELWSEVIPPGKSNRVQHKQLLWVIQIRKDAHRIPMLLRTAGVRGIVRRCPIDALAQALAAVMRDCVCWVAVRQNSPRKPAM